LGEIIQDLLFLPTQFTAVVQPLFLEVLLDNLSIAAGGEHFLQGMAGGDLRLAQVGFGSFSLLGESEIAGTPLRQTPRCTTFANLATPLAPPLTLAAMDQIKVVHGALSLQ
jgi:hypothetical protein